MLWVNVSFWQMHVDSGIRNDQCKNQIKKMVSFRFEICLTGRAKGIWPQSTIRLMMPALWRRMAKVRVRRNSG